MDVDWDQCIHSNKTYGINPVNIFLGLTGRNVDIIGRRAGNRAPWTRVIADNRNELSTVGS